MNCNVKRCFSLVELLVAMVIIMILFGIAVGLFALINDKIKISKTEVIVKQISAAMQAYRADQGYYFMNPTPFQSLSSDTDPVNADNRFKLNLGEVVDTEFIKYFDYESLKGRSYIRTVTGAGGYSYIVDAWGRSLLYRTPDANPPTNGIINSSMFDIGSLGKDGMYGNNSANPADFGKGDDITNFNY